jgi:1,4-dihydroxy-2-naphthoate octaprenyltransferase
MKRSVTLILCAGIVAVGLWVIGASHTLDSACTLSAQTGGGTSCVSGFPFFLFGIALIATGIVSVIVAISNSIRDAKRDSARRSRTTISTLRPQANESLRDVA